MNTIQFEPIKTTITPQFWTELMSFKLYDAKLDSQKVEIKGWYEGGRYKRLKAVLKPTAATSTSSTNKDQYNIYEAPATVSLQEFHSDSATSRDKKAQGWQCICGDLYNTNTIEEFLKLDRNNLMKEYTKQIQQDIESGRATKDPSLLFRFIATTFADLKKYKFYYWLGYPSIVEKVQSKGLSNGDNADLYSKLELAVDKYGEKEMIELCQEYKRHTERKDGQTEIFCIGRRKGKNEIGSTQEGRSGQINIEDGSGNEAVWKIGNLVEWEDMERDPSIEKVMVGFIDPTGNRQKMGWMLRNIMVWLRRWHRKGSEEGGIEILSFRDYKYTENYQSLVVTVDSNINEVGLKEYKSVGWERNIQGKLQPKMADLSSTMSTEKIAETSLNLNLQLMKWRVAPKLDLELIANSKCLLVGSGTLGCYVSRSLLAWGVKKITLVDNGTISYSNPPRQPLFNFEDVGKPKAICAAENIKKIYPGIEAQGVQLEIPMPGHPISSSEKEQQAVLDAIEKLDELVQSHDVVFLLTDSRESRWLPAVVSAVHKKLVICSALGFDGFVVLRHGVDKAVGENSEQEGGDNAKLGCYFCNDVVAPTDSVSDRTLDQQCTVTRPGLAPIAAGFAVELMVSVLQHPDSVHSTPKQRAINAKNKGASDSSESDESDYRFQFGKYPPHQIRGFLGGFELLSISGPSYDKCTACSATITSAYSEFRTDFLLNAFNDSSYLEDLTGLSELHKSLAFSDDSFGSDGDEGQENIGSNNGTNENDDDDLVFI